MKILLVDDARSVVMVMTSRLASYGYDVVYAPNGKAAVDMFASSAPDLVLMDIEMPLMNGFEATNRIRAFEATQQWAWVPILFLTASDTPENLVTAIEAGGDDDRLQQIRVGRSVGQAQLDAPATRHAHQMGTVVA